MKFGLMIEYETRNIGDDIQAYATKRFLPTIDYLVDRNHLDEFVPNTEEYVAMIINGWFLQYTLNWPISPYIKPLPISMHFTYKDWFWDTTDRAYHLSGFGLDYLKSIEPIGCRDSHTQKLLESKGIKTEYTGCMTLTINKFDNIEKQDYICAVDVSEEVVNQIRKTTDMEVKVITHTVPEDYYELSWEQRMKNVEDLLKIYQGAKAVVSYRLHCALPCLALGTKVILLNEDYRNDRFGDYTVFMESCSEEDFISGKVKYDYRNLPDKNDDWKKIRNNLIKRCEEYIKKMEMCNEKYSEISIKDYQKYCIDKSNWLKDATIESYNRYKSEKKSKEILENEIQNFQKKNDELIYDLQNVRNKCDEYKDIIQKKENDISNYQKRIGEYKIKEEEQKKIIDNNLTEILKFKDSTNYYHKEFDECVVKLEEYKKELESIKASKWWKIRNIIKK